MADQKPFSFSLFPLSQALIDFFEALKLRDVEEPDQADEESSPIDYKKFPNARPPSLPRW